MASDPGAAPLMGDDQSLGPRNLGSSASEKHVSVFKTLSKYMPILEWLPRYEVKELLLKDVSCGITLGCILIGQSLAHASLSNVSVIHGPYSCMLPPIVYAVFGTCNQASVGTGGLLALLTGTSIARLDFGSLHAAGHSADLTSERDHAAAVLSLLVGLMMALMGIFQLSFLVRFLSRPALSGFITGSALLIIKAMVMPMLGMPKKYASGGMLPLVMHPERLLETNPATISLSLLSLAFLYFAKRIPQKKVKEFKELIVLAVTAGICCFTAKQTGIELVGSVPSGLPRLEFPLRSAHHLGLAKALLPDAALIALVCFISSFASAKKCGMKGGYQVVALNELLGLGFANVAGALVGAVPTQIGLSRSALAYGMGVRTPLGANVFVAFSVVGIVQVFSPALSFVPRCVLNAIIVNAALGLFEFQHAKQLWEYHDRLRKRTDWMTWVAAFAGTLGFGAFEGILFAVLISLLLAIRQIVNPKMDILGQLPNPETPGGLSWVNIKRYPQAREIPGVLIIRLDGPFFYANCERFQDRVVHLELEAAQRCEVLQAIVLSAGSIPFVDSTSVEVLREMMVSFKERGVKFFIANAYGGPREFLLKAVGNLLIQGDIRINVDACIELFNSGAGSELDKRSPSSSAASRKSSIRPLPCVLPGP